MHPAKTPVTSRGRAKHVIAVLVVPDSVALEVTVVHQVFGPRMAAIAELTGDADSAYEVVLCGEEPRQVLSSGVDFGELAPLETLLTADTVMVPGVEEPLAERPRSVVRALRGAADAGARMVSFCGGAFLLARAGLLDGRRATTHWLFTEEFCREFPQVKLEPGCLYVDDGRVHTSGGIFSATDLALHLLAEDLGQAYAGDVGRLLVTAPRRPGGQAQFVKDSIRIAGEPALGSFLAWLREHLHEPLTLAGLASQVHLSERSLVRKFRRATGMTVFDWINRERVAAAKVLLETTDHRISEIAAMVGFGSAETLRRHFERQVGTTAGSYRATFRATPAAS
ncbi:MULTISPECIES: GlxA family transcriptional regulator [unclassified Amycolatopsis]|uniref:GlxA family transcriptional regulator n=1 Tax=unclassified Amycolatopsis TaxID=2618356 RepID=UPI001C6A746B|nr:helix-turn-helix domain-containing protein [Amycolatopsis sp. DSM 110486]QYN18149.1 helix-turn-helix domain-containing protein [Amycolatopsis sp. DSM 110486]